MIGDCVMVKKVHNMDDGTDVVPASSNLFFLLLVNILYTTSYKLFIKKIVGTSLGPMYVNPEELSPF
jgi:hypothetical protein